MIAIRFPYRSFVAFMTILPMVAFAEQPASDRRATVQISVAPVTPCTQLERQVGLGDDKCGHYTISELARMKADAED